MRKTIKYFLIAIAVIPPLWITLMFTSAAVRLISFYPVGLTYLYKEVGITKCQTKDGVKSLHIYKQRNKPFLLVGPYKFAEDYNDFFFVAEDCVLRTAVDKGSEWIIAGGYLLLNDDMTDYWNCTRAPYWFDAAKGDGRISWDSQTQCHVFKINLDSKGKEPVTFSLPAKYFTDDMSNAELFFDCDKIPPPRIIRMIKKVVSQ